jgi:chromosome segregation ATPase
LIDSLKKTVEELHQQVDRLEKQVKDQEAMVTRYDQENKEYDILNKDLEKQIQELKSTGGDRHLSTEKLSQISQGTLSLEAEVHKLTATLQEREKKIVTLKEKIASYDDRLKKLEAKKAVSEKPS